MGSKSPDRWLAEDWRATAETAGKMLDEGWRVLSMCPSCNLSMWTDLALIIRITGRDTVLWNRRVPCRRIGCTGQAHFVGHPPGCGSKTIKLDAEWVGPVRYPPGGRR